MRKLVCVVFCVYVLLLATAAAQVTFTTIDVPGAVVTDVLGINNAGDMVGYYANSASGPTHGFLFSDGSFTTLDYPGADSTRAASINDSGQIVGCALKGDAAEVGFLYDGGTFTTIRVPGTSATVAQGINNNADIVGGDGTLGGTHGFLLRNHRFKSISPPGTYTYVYGTSINNLGQIVGWTSSGLETYGFVYSRGKYRKIAVPGALQTEAWRINDDGVIVGWYQSGASFSGFSFTVGEYSPITYPAAVYTLALGINNAGQIVGICRQSQYLARFCGQPALSWWQITALLVHTNSVSSVSPVSQRCGATEGRAKESTDCGCAVGGQESRGSCRLSPGHLERDVGGGRGPGESPPSQSLRYAIGRRLPLSRSIPGPSG